MIQKQKGCPEEGCVIGEPEESSLMKWLRLVPIILAVVIPLLAGATAWVTTRVDAANAAQETQLRKDFVETKVYESERKSAEYQRDQIMSHLDKIDKKLDELIARQK